MDDVLLRCHYSSPPFVRGSRFFALWQKQGEDTCLRPHVCLSCHLGVIPTYIAGEKERAGGQKVGPNYVVVSRHEILRGLGAVSQMLDKATGHLFNSCPV